MIRSGPVVYGRRSRSAVLLSALLSISLVACAPRGSSRPASEPPVSEGVADPQEALVRYLLPLGKETSIMTTKIRAYCLGLARLKGWSHNGADTSWMPELDTLGDPSPALLDRFAAYAPPVRPVSACERKPYEFAPNPPTLVFERATGAPALIIWIGPVAEHGQDVAIARVGYYENGLSSAGWRCTLVSRDSRWTVRECTMEWIS